MQKRPRKRQITKKQKFFKKFKSYRRSRYQRPRYENETYDYIPPPTNPEQYTIHPWRLAEISAPAENYFLQHMGGKIKYHNE
jgi:hypothetical protein